MPLILEPAYHVHYEQLPRHFILNMGTNDASVGVWSHLGDHRPVAMATAGPSDNKQPQRMISSPSTELEILLQFSP